MTISRFRLIVILWIVAYGWLFSLPLGHYKLPAPVLEVLKYSRRGAILDGTAGEAYVLLFLGICSALGLLMFSRAARGGFVAFTIATVGLVPLGGVRVIPAFDAFLATVAVLLHGAVLAAAFSSPLSELFHVPEASEDEAETIPEELIEVYETSDSSLVPLIASRLMEAGIEFVTPTEELPVRFLVRETDVAAAKHAIQEDIVN